ncbi:MAG TPA: hypothetical protein VMR45_05750 [Patescibacteria group bacterium]|nr:hypothetical protein [Patescibacteria group bacterium]
MNYNQAVTAERYHSPQELASEFKHTPGIVTEPVTDGSHFVVDVDAFDAFPLAPAVCNPARGITQTLRYVVTAPNGIPYGLVEGVLKDEQGEPTARRFFLTSFPKAEHDRAHIASTLAPGMTDEVDDQLGAWRSGVTIGRDNSHVAFMHSGDGQTEIIGAFTELPSLEGTLPFQVWAPPSAEIQDAILQTL